MLPSTLDKSAAALKIVYSSERLLKFLSCSTSLVNDLSTQKNHLERDGSFGNPQH